MSLNRRLAWTGALLLGLVSFAYGYLSRATGLFPDRLLSGSLGPKARKTAAPAPAAAAPGAAKSAEQRERDERLMAVGYAAGYSAPFERSGVVTHDKARASPGLNLVVSGHEPSAFLMDMDGKVRHRWAKTFREAWPARQLEASEQYRSRHWKRVYLYPNGDLLALFEGIGLIKLDRDSKVLWTYWDSVHHDLDVDPAGNILVLVWRQQTLAGSNPQRQVLADNIVFLNPAGQRTRGIAVLSALEASRWGALVRFPHGTGTDILHTNTLSLLDGRHERTLPAFRRGNLLVALRNLDLIGVIDPEKGQFVWGLAGMWHQPHEPALLPNGHLLVFDNYGRRSGEGHRSLAVEVDPVTQEVVWSFGGEPEFFSKVVGMVQRLPNGNTLVTSSTEARVLEVTNGGELVWEFRNPHQVVEDDQKKAATLFEVVRIPAARVAWLPPEPKGAQP